MYVYWSLLRWKIKSTRLSIIKKGLVPLPFLLYLSNFFQIFQKIKKQRSSRKRNFHKINKDDLPVWKNENKLFFHNRFHIVDFRSRVSVPSPSCVWPPSRRPSTFSRWSTLHFVKSCGCAAQLLADVAFVLHKKCQTPAPAAAAHRHISTPKNPLQACCVSTDPLWNVKSS